MPKSFFDEIKEAQDSYNGEVKVSEPPCKDCANWKPVIITGADGVFIKVKCCHGDMKDDFSCFIDKPIEDDDLPF